MSENNEMFTVRLGFFDEFSRATQFNLRVKSEDDVVKIDLHSFSNGECQDLYIKSLKNPNQIFDLDAYLEEEKTKRRCEACGEELGKDVISALDPSHPFILCNLCPSCAQDLMSLDIPVSLTEFVERRKRGQFRILNPNVFLVDRDNDNIASQETCPGSKTPYEYTTKEGTVYKKAARYSKEGDSYYHMYMNSQEIEETEKQNQEKTEKTKKQEEEKQAKEEKENERSILQAFKNKDLVLSIETHIRKSFAERLRNLSDQIERENTMISEFVIAFASDLYKHDAVKMDIINRFTDVFDLAEILISIEKSAESQRLFAKRNFTIDTGDDTGDFIKEKMMKNIDSLNMHTIDPCNYTERREVCRGYFDPPAKNEETPES